MRVSIEACDEELAGLADALVCHVCELRDGAQARLSAREDAALSKARTSIKAHPHLLLNQVRRDWLDGYRAQMEAMNGAIASYLRDLPDAQADSKD